MRARSITIIPAQPDFFVVEPVYEDEDGNGEAVELRLTPVVAWAVAHGDVDGETRIAAEAVGPPGWYWPEDLGDLMIKYPDGRFGDHWDRVYRDSDHALARFQGLDRIRTAETNAETPAER
jgi:hypothetical protein